MILDHNPVFIEPEIWGKHYWYVIETMILSMDTQEIISKESLRLFFYSLQNLLPCPVCREHLQIYLEKNDIDKYIDTKKKIFLWIYQLRKEIQIRNKKPYPTFEEYLKKINHQIISETPSGESKNFISL